MKKPHPNVLELPPHERALMALEAAVEGVMEEHARAGRPVYVMRDGNVVEISAKELGILYPDHNKQESRVFNCSIVFALLPALIR